MKEENKNLLKFGTAGIPQTTPLNYPNSKNTTADGILEVRNLNLDALELEFVRSVYLKKASKEKIDEIKDNSKREEIDLSIHAPYFINLNAKEEYKIENSIRYIFDSLIVGQKINARTVLFHPGYFLKQPRDLVLEKIEGNINKILDRYNNSKDKKLKNKVNLGLELTGKKTQVGSLDDILYFYDHLKYRNVIPVFDFAHMHARYNGHFLNKGNISSFFDKLKSYPKILNNFHGHISGIEYTIKGERKHLMLEDSDLPYKKLISNLKDLKTKGTLICESPIPYKDAKLLKKFYSNI
jgi:deoxyribonuclease-4